ncbi:MAG: glycosyltransferase family 4 protein [Armatimonadetes bacterium]|nr:glycosyltransferase family 4 protein [Armatimonadota bacterium]
MRIMMLSWEYPPRIVGGISPHVYELSQQLAKLGVEIHVITKATPLAPIEEIEPSGVHVHRVQPTEHPNDFIHEIQLLNDATELKVRQLLEESLPTGTPTIFHAHDWLSLDSARDLKYEYSLPLVATIHATEEGRHGGIFNDTSRYIHEQEYWLTYEAWRVIVCTHFMKGEIQRSFNCPADKIDVIFNGVDPAKFQFEWSAEGRAARRAQLAKPDEQIVIYVGRFVREKGIQVLLNCASAVLARRPKTKFVIVGGGARDRFEKFVEWAGLSDNVVFTGFQSNRPLHELYRCADVAVFPSLYEPFGIVALEAMAAGVPVVASDAGGLREVVVHDYTGTSSYANDPESLAWAILRVLEDPVRAKNLNECAQGRLGTDFNWANIAAQTLEVYERVWSEFLSSYWADRTLWPVSPGAEERARTREFAVSHVGNRPRPMVNTSEGVPLEFEHEEVEKAGRGEI